jgi:hypothetical protein
VNKMAFWKKEYWTGDLLDILQIRRFHIVIFLLGIEAFTMGATMIIMKTSNGFDWLFGLIIGLIGLGLIYWFSHEFTKLNKNKRYEL